MRILASSDPRLHLAHGSNAAIRHFCAAIEPNYSASKPDIPPDWKWRVPMENLFYAATSLGDAVATRHQQTGAL
jgi:hypothetical protein